MKLSVLLTFATLLTAPSAAQAQATKPLTLDCGTPAAPSAAAGEVPNLHGNWDFLMIPRGAPSFGLLSIGFVGTEYGGALVPTRTAPVVLRKVVLQGRDVQLLVASTEGDVRFDGRLSGKGDTMCGTVTYHGGERFPMVAHKRPSTYRSASQAERAQQAVPSRR